MLKICAGHALVLAYASLAAMEEKKPIARILRETAQLRGIDGAISDDGYRTLQEGDAVEFEIVERL